MIRVTLILGLVANLTAAQLTLGTVSKLPGQTASLSSVLSTGGAQMSGLQWDLIYDNSNLTITATAGPAATAAGKMFQTTPLANGLRIFIIGFNQTLIADGDLADLAIQLAANATPGKYPLVFTNVTATDINGNIVLLGTLDGLVTIVAPLTVSTPSALPAGTANITYQAPPMAATGGNSPYTWSATGLPGGLSLAAGTGIISGTPATSAGSPFNVQVTVTDANSATANKSYTLTVNPALSITGPSSLPVGTANLGYQTLVTATGGSSPYSWSATGLPNGMSIAAGTGIISGTPAITTGGSYHVQVTVTDNNLATAGVAYTLTVNGPLTILGPAALPAGTANAAYSSITVNATGGSGTYAWSAAGLPNGMTIAAATGAITGTPATSAGSPFNVRVTVTDGNSATANCSYTLTVNPVLSITAPASLPVGTVNLAYPPTTATATGGSSIYTWSATGLPNGLNIAAGTGAITGTPATSAGSPFSVQITVTDSHSAATNRLYSLTVNGPLAVAAPATLPEGTAASVYLPTTLTATGGSTPYTWSANGLPGGMSIAPGTGIVSGMPATNTGSPFTVQVTVADSNSVTANRSYSLTINPALTVSGPANLQVGTANSVYQPATVTATGGRVPYMWSATGLPNGMNIAAATGVISGTPPTGAGSAFHVQVTVTDSNSAMANQSYSLTVNAALGISGPAELPPGIVSAPYQATTATADGGAAPYIWTATGLPGGLSIAAGTGVISGTPVTNTGSPFNVQVWVTDSNLVRTSRGYAIAISAPLSISGPVLLPVGTVNSGYTLTTVTATGGSGVYSWSATGLPGGMNIGSTTGIIGGTPAGNTGSPFHVQVQVIDSTSTTANISYTLTINTLPLTITAPSALPAGILNVAYPATPISAEGGLGNYRWSATGLPPGLSLDGSGTLTGNPATALGSPFSVQVTVTDDSSATASRSYSLTISGLLTVAAPPSLPLGTVAVAYTATTFIAGGGVAPYTWAATGLPPGLNLGIATGTITGTPTTNNGSPYAVRVTVTDSTGATANRPYAGNIAPVHILAVTAPPALPSGTVNVSYPLTIPVVEGNNGACTWWATGLPAGLTMDPVTGTLTGTPASGTGSPYNVVFWVKDSASASASRSYSLTVNLAVTNLPATSGVSNAAGGQAVVAPNSWVSIYGSNFVTQGTSDDWSKSIAGGKLPTILDGVSVSFGGKSAYVSFVSPGQINVLLPEVGFGPVPVTVTTPAGISTPLTVDSQQYSPAFFPLPDSQPVATHLDYTLAAKDGTYQSLRTVPAKPGEVIILWCAGFGPTNPPAPGGVPIPATPTYNTASPVTVTIGSVPALVYGTALASGFAGLYQLVVTIPDSLPDGDYKLIATINGVLTPAMTFTLHN